MESKSEFYLPKQLNHLEENFEFLKELFDALQCNTPKHVRKPDFCDKKRFIRILKCATDVEILTLLELCKNLLHGNINLQTNEIMSLIAYKSFFETVYKTRSMDRARKKFIKANPIALWLFLFPIVTELDKLFLI